MVAVSQRQLLSTCNVASASEEISFLIILKFKQPHEARGLDSIINKGRDQFGEISGPQFSHLGVRLDPNIVLFCEEEVCCKRADCREVKGEFPFRSSSVLWYMRTR